MIIHRNLLGTSLLTLLLISLFITVQPVFCQSYDPTPSFQTANDSINIAFDTVLKAEKAGANIKGLLAQLNVAANLLANAENSYRSGDTSTIESNTDQAVAIARQVTAQATTLGKSATEAQQTAILTSILIAVLGSVIFVLALILVWQVFKKRYIKKVLESKPEVVDN